MIRVPPIKDVATAVEIYYSHPFLTNEHITQLFGKMNRNKIAALKRLAKDVAEEEGALNYNSTTVNTECAYKAWGIDIERCEWRLKKMLDLGIFTVPK